MIVPGDPSPKIHATQLLHPDVVKWPGNDTRSRYFEFAHICLIAYGIIRQYKHVFMFLGQSSASPIILCLNHLDLVTFDPQLLLSVLQMCHIDHFNAMMLVSVTCSSQA
jgi:hypothetical protein